MKHSYTLLLAFIFVACKQASKLPKIAPNVITQQTLHDTDDPAIWVNKKDPSKSIVFGTDKETEGAIYAFDLNGKIIEEKTIRNIARPNNVDVAYDFKLNDSTFVDVLAFAEREKSQIRLFSVPEMKPLDNGGFKVFQKDSNPDFKQPMGISLFKNPKNGAISAIVSRKAGPKNNYLHQYAFNTDSTGAVSYKLERAFGEFSGKKEIEAIAVDNEMGFVYYSDEQFCIRKYHADPAKGNDELSCFGGEYFSEDIEGIAIARTGNDEGYIIVSNQQLGEFNLFDRKTNEFVKAVNLSTTETDGCDVVTTPLNDTFKHGLFVAMNDNKEFYFYDLKKVISN